MYVMSSKSNLPKVIMGRVENSFILCLFSFNLKVLECPTRNPIVYMLIFHYACIKLHFGIFAQLLENKKSNNVPFAIGTTSGDRKKLMETMKNANIYVVDCTTYGKTSACSFFSALFCGLSVFSVINAFSCDI